MPDLHRSRDAYRYTKELSVYIADNYQRQGLATVLYKAIIEIIKLQGITNTLIGISLPNERSVAFHENFGFQNELESTTTLELSLENSCDVGWWELPISDQPTSEILPYNSFAKENMEILRKYTEYLNTR